MHPAVMLLDIGPQVGPDRRVWFYLRAALGLASGLGLASEFGGGVRVRAIVEVSAAVFATEITVPPLFCSRFASTQEVVPNLAPTSITVAVGDTHLRTSCTRRNEMCRRKSQNT